MDYVNHIMDDLISFILTTDRYREKKRERDLHHLLLSQMPSVARARLRQPKVRGLEFHLGFPYEKQLLAQALQQEAGLEAK